MIGYDTYVQANYDHGCCQIGTKNNVSGYHRRCVCDHIHEKDQCQELCSKDTLCKGFVILSYTHANYTNCQIATTVEECPINCRGPYYKDNVSPLDPDGQCSSSGLWEGGCYIKQGMNAKMP